MAAGPWLRLVVSGLRRVYPHRRLLGWGGIAAYTHLSPLIATSQDHTPTSGVVNRRIKVARSAVRVRLTPRLRAAAVLVLECVDVAEAETVLASLPIVAAGLFSFDGVPPRAYAGFARLFEPTDPA
jgi:hypothetical protein